MQKKKNCTIAQCQCVSWKKISAAVILISPGNFVSKCQKSSFLKKTFFPFKILIYILAWKNCFFHFFKVDRFVKNGSWWNKLILVFYKQILMQTVKFCLCNLWWSMHFFPFHTRKDLIKYKLPLFYNLHWVGLYNIFYKSSWTHLCIWPQSV